MQIETKFHGTIEIQEETVWTFPKGVPGFDDEKAFVLLPIEGNDLFHVLQSTTTPIVAFITADPYTLVDDYTFKVDDPTLDLLGIQQETDVVVLGVLSVKDPFESSTINLQAPLIFNTVTKKGKQMIMNDNAFNMRHPIAQPLSTEGEA